MKKLILFIIISVAVFSVSNAQSYFVTTVAGNGTQGFINGPRVTTAELYWPYGLAYDGDSVIYFSDSYNHAIRKISSNTNLVTTIAGGNGIGLLDGAGSTAKFYNPDDLFFKNGFLYVGDNMNNCVRKIDLSNNIVSTVAGTGAAGYQDGVASSAMFHGGNGIALAIDNNNDIYVADGTNAVVRKISGGMVSTIAGTPGSYGYIDGAASSAKFHRPRYLALDTASGALYITDINNNVIRKLYNGQVSTFSGTGVAGGTDGAYNVATFSAPVGIDITVGGYFYVVDGGGNKLRKIDPNGTVTTIAGNGTFGFQDGAAASAEFYYPQDLCYDKHCYIYIADRNNNRIRKISVLEGYCATDVSTLPNQESRLNIYPNPNSGVFNVQFSINPENATYKIFNIIGNEVKSGAFSLAINKIDLSDLAEGMYTIIVSQKDKTFNSKISLQK